jgi:hypothetical protein
MRHLADPAACDAVWLSGEVGVRKKRGGKEGEGRRGRGRGGEKEEMLQDVSWKDRR